MAAHTHAGGDVSRVVHFEIHAADPERAAAFYRQLFGWEITSWEGPVEYWMVRTGAPDQPGIDGGLMRRRGSGPVDGQAVNSYVCTVDVSDLDGTLRRVTDLGGTVAVAKMPIPSVGWIAYVKDPEGNLVGVMQADPAASEATTPDA